MASDEKIKIAYFSTFETLSNSLVRFQRKYIICVQQKMCYYFQYSEIILYCQTQNKLYSLNCILNKGDTLKMILEKLSWKFVSFRRRKVSESAERAHCFDLSTHALNQYFVKIRSK